MNAQKSREILRISKETKYHPRCFLHARPTAAFVKRACSYDSEIVLEYNGDKYNGKSIMSVLMINLPPDSEMIIHAIGVDAVEAINGLIDILHRYASEE